MGKLIAFPKGGIAYNERLYAAAAALGLEVTEGVWSGKWLFSNVRRDDVLHFHWISFDYYRADSELKTLLSLLRFFALGAIARLRGGRIVWTAHNLYPHDRGRYLWPHRLARKYTIAIAERVLAHGPSAAVLLRDEFGIPLKKLTVIPHGNWIDQYPQRLTSSEARRRLGIPEDTFVYGFIGLCKPYKNLEGLIAAYAQLDGNAMLIIAGEFRSSEYLALVRRLAERTAGTIRIEARFLTDEEIALYLAALDVMVTPYKEILTSGSIMLALSAGKPVVAPRLGGIVDVIGDRHGILYDAESSDGLEQALIEVRGRTFDHAAIVEYARSFKWETSAQVLCDIVERRPVPKFEEGSLTG